MAKAILIRHANANKIPQDRTTEDGYADDLARTLSDKGVEQAVNRSQALADVTVGRVFSSSAERAINTGEIVTGKSRDVFEILPELCIADPKLGGDGQVLDHLFANVLGYAPPRKWAEHDNGALTRLGEAGATALFEKIFDGSAEETIVVMGHAVFIPAIALAMAGGTTSRYADELLDLELAEAGAIILTVEEGVVTDVDIQN